MSDPVTNVEIEDVLSSIRRLVSNDGRAVDAAPDARPAQRNTPGAPKPAPEADASEPERLVLTPSLRIDNAASEQGDAPVDLSQDLRVDSSEHEVHAQDVGDDWDAHVDAPEDGADAMQGRMSEERHADEMPDLDGAPNPSEDGAGDTADWRPESLKLRVAELEEVVARQSDQWEPDGPGEDENSGSPVDPLPWEDYMPSAEDTPDNTGGNDTETTRSPDTAEKTIEDAIAKAAQPSRSKSNVSAKEMAPKPDDSQDIPDNFVAQETATATADDAAETDLLAGSDEFLDEDALRDLVADIVRQELQGALGERITRNVRKLVRREIHRALASQELQ